VRLGVWLERLAVLLVSLALSVGLIAVLSGFFAGRDQAGITGDTEIPGQRLPDQGDAHLTAGVLRPPYATDPPASGAHVPLSSPVQGQGHSLSNDQLLSALELGDVVITYGSAEPPAGLRGLADRVGGPFSPALAAAGQAVVLARRPGVHGLLALAWARRFEAASAADPGLARFAQTALGHGARNR
jgi:hypothetical protein